MHGEAVVEDTDGAAPAIDDDAVKAAVEISGKIRVRFAGLQEIRRRAAAPSMLHAGENQRDVAGRAAHGPRIVKGPAACRPADIDPELFIGQGPCRIERLMLHRPDHPPELGLGLRARPSRDKTNYARH